MEISINGGSPKWMVYRKNPMKMDDFGVPPFVETPIWKSERCSKPPTSQLYAKFLHVHSTPFLGAAVLLPRISPLLAGARHNGAPLGEETLIECPYIQGTNPEEKQGVQEYFTLGRRDNTFKNLLG